MDYCGPKRCYNDITCVDLVNGYSFSYQPGCTVRNCKTSWCFHVTDVVSLFSMLFHTQILMTADGIHVKTEGLAMIVSMISAVCAIQDTLGRHVILVNI